MKHLLDTNAFVDHLRRGPTSKVTAKLLAAPPGSVYLCTVVLAELLYGAVRSGPAHEAANRALIAGLRAQFPSLPFDEPAAEERPYWEEFFELVKVKDAHTRSRCRDLNGSEAWACCECDCTERLEAWLSTRDRPFLEVLRAAARPR